MYQNAIYTEKAIAADSNEKHELIGFNSRYNNIVDYILKITHEIWEEKGIGVLYETYAENIQLHITSSTFSGVNGVISSTLATQNALPDRRNFGQEVIWSKAENSRFFSSHRLISTATHLGRHTMYGAPTGKMVTYSIMADCLIEKNKIIEEWLVRDNYFLLQQLGLNPIDVARKSDLYKIKKQSFTNHQGVENRLGQFNVVSSDLKNESSGHLIGNLYQNALNGRYFNLIPEFYHEKATLHTICDQDYQGIRQIQNFYISLFSSIPHANMVIDRITVNTDEDNDKVSIRWWLKGIHLNEGIFGTPSNKEIEVMGISHYLVKDGKITEEWTLFDVFDVLCQIHSGESDMDLPF